MNKKVYDSDNGTLLTIHDTGWVVIKYDVITGRPKYEVRIRWSEEELTVPQSILSVITLSWDGGYIRERMNLDAIISKITCVSQDQFKRAVYYDLRTRRARWWKR